MPRPSDICKKGHDKRLSGMRLDRTCVVCQKARQHVKQKGYSLKAKFGISQTDWNLLFQHQKGVCAGCNREATGYHGLGVDHCHKTGYVRGLLCSNCNTALGLLKDNPDTLNRLIGYLHASIT